MFVRIILLILVFSTSACHHESFGVGKVIDTVICQKDAAQSYALYIPSNNTGAIIYFFDAHAAGALPLNKYKSLADKYGYILVGSNNSKNGNDWSITENIWQTISDDTKSRLKIDTSRIYTCGFSGGAKVAGYIALKYPGIKSVIANGAGLPDGTPAGDFPFTYTGIAGEGDLNLTDIVAFNNALDHTATKHHLILFDGKHEWAPVPAMDIAFAGLQSDAGIIPKDYIVKSKARLDTYIKAKQLLKAAEECRLSISYLVDTSWFTSKLVALVNDPVYQQQFQQQKDILIKEQNIKAGYAEHFDTNTDYWFTTINDLKAAANVQSAERAMDQRLLAYLSLAFYSFSNHFIQSHSNDAARHFVDLYKMVDPDNNEAWYFSAVLYARAENAEATEKDLLKSVEYGFKDKARLQQQEEFQKLAGRINIITIERKMN
jgi:dienelactone hydrolase